MGNPYNYQRPVAPDSNMFFGRQELLQELITGLTQKEPKSYAIYGGRRMGKTSLMRRLEFELHKRNDRKEQPIVIPIYIDLQMDPPSNIQHFFNRLRNRLSEWHEGILGENDPLPEISEELPATSFAAVFRTLYENTVRIKSEEVQLALLMDESEKLQREPWANELDDNLRALLSNVPGVSEFMGLAFTGGTDLYKDMVAPNAGSPLRNICDERMIEAVSADDMRRLASEPLGDRHLSEEVTKEILRLAGGHLFLGQYLMNNLFELGFDHCTPAKVREVAENFPYDRKDFAKWIDAIEEQSTQIYRSLVPVQEPQNRPALAKAVGISGMEARRAIDKLVFHGIIKQTDNKLYSTYGDMFKEWFEQDVSEENSDSDLINYGSVNIIDLKNSLVDKLDDSDLKKFCFELNESDIDFDDLTGSVEEKLIDILKKAKSRNKVDDFCHIVIAKRPDIHIPV